MLVRGWGAWLKRLEGKGRRVYMGLWPGGECECECDMMWASVHAVAMLESASSLLSDEGCRSEKQKRNDCASQHPTHVLSSQLLLSQTPRSPPRLGHVSPPPEPRDPSPDPL